MTVPEVLPMPENLAESPRPYFNPRLPDGRRPQQLFMFNGFKTG